MPRKKKKLSKKHILHGHIVSLLCISILLLLLAAMLAAKLQPKRVLLETNKTEVKRIPLEIKKKLEAAAPSATFRVPILIYHYIEYVQDKKDTIRRSLNIPPYIFEQQIITLKDAGYTFMTAKDLGDVLDGKKGLPEKAVLLTIDDGHWDLYTDVLPILKKYQAKATAYVAPGLLNGSDFLNTKQLEAVAESGLIEIGAHTVHHMWLKGRPLITVKLEVEESKSMLEKLTHKPVVSFAYPFGAFDEQAEKVVKEAGFKTAVSTVSGIEDSQANRYFLFRIRPGGRVGKELLLFLEQKTFKPW